MIETLIFIILIFILTFLSGYFSGSEAALFSLSIPQIKNYQADANPRKKLIASLLSHPQDLLVTIFMLNTLVNILLQNVTSSAFGNLAGWEFKIGVPLVLTLIFGELVPKYIGLQNNVKFAYQVAPIIDLLQRWLKPIRRATIAITTPISHILFFYLKKEKSITKEELEHALKTSEEHGVFDADEGELIYGYLQLQDTLVKELMWPREDIIFYNIQEPLSKLTHLFVDKEVSRILVCDNGLEKLLGIMSAKQFLLHRNLIKKPMDLMPYLAKPFYVPETIQARLLLRRFNERGEVMAVVVDEYSSITGLITREDLMEVVIGEIIDLRDQTDLYAVSGKNEVIANGKLELAIFNEIFDVDFNSPTGMVTIGGWLTERLGEIPKSGSKHVLENFLFHVLEATQSRIVRIYIRKLSGEKR
jgi:putative hemolysin